MKLSTKTNDYLIHCTLIEVDLSTDPAYEALSYTWAIDSDISGPQTETSKRPIICNDATLDVFKNLHNALAQLQELGWTSKPVWIDAICINQEDDVEKSVQVNMMGAIFRGASRVVVWLGQSSLATSLALKKALPYFTDEDPPGATATARSSSTTMALVATQALAWLLSRGWFARVWTLQEAVLAREVVYLVGAQPVPLDRLVQLDYLNAVGVMDSLFAPVLTRIAGLVFTRAAHELVGGGGACTLEMAVKEARHRRAKDGRDKLFGVLSLCQCQGSGDAGGLAADYQKPVQEVYRECAAALLRSKNTGIFLLSLVGQIRYGCEVDYAFHSRYIKLFKPEDGFVAGIPSWVPDLSAPARPSPLRDLSKLDFSAALSVEPSFSITGDKGTVLQLKAAALDVITSTGDCHSRRLVQPIWRLLRIPSELAGSPKDTYLPTGEPVVSAFWRTLVAGAKHADDDEETELTDEHFSEWFAVFADQSSTLAEGTMRKAILQESDGDDLDLAVEPDERRRPDYRRVLTNDKNARLMDRYKIQTVRRFLASFDSPAFGFREMIRRRHEAKNAFASLDDDDSIFKAVYEKFYTDRRIFATQNGYMGTAPWTAKNGDVIMLVAGAYVPYVFRPSEEKKGSWELVGEAYCHGLMFGKGVEHDGVDFGTIDVV